MDTTIAKLLERGDSVSIVEGRLKIVPHSGRIVPSEWLKNHGMNLLEGIAKLDERDLFVYESYSTGRYSKNRYEGITLQFVNLTTAEEAYTIFNVELTRGRNTNKGNKGSPLPDGQFRLNKKSQFIQFWDQAKLSMPPRRSSFHDYMGNLRGILFMGSYTQNNRLDTKTLKPVNISSDEIKRKLMPYNSRTTAIQLPYNCHTKMPYKETPVTIENKGIERFSTTCEINYGISKQGGTVIRDIPSLPIKPEEQTTEEWLEDYEKAKCLTARL
jgi:hypothetical protein